MFMAFHSSPRRKRVLISGALLLLLHGIGIGLVFAR
jgi:hypothetical protein